MNKSLQSCWVLIAVMLLMSCKTNKDLVYLNNTLDKELQEGGSTKAPIYRINKSDNLYVNIQSLSPEVNTVFNASQSEGGFRETSGQYLNGFLVDLKGDIKLPFIGAVHIEGLTLEEATIAIQKKADEYIKGATIKVKLLSFKVTILGEVKTPGVYYNFSNNLTILDAIGLANGITDYGKIKQVLVMRPTAEGSRTHRLDLTNKAFLTSDVYYLQPNDVVYVEPDQYKSMKINYSMYSMLLSSLSITLALVGFFRGL